MTANREGQDIFLDTYPIEEELMRESNSETPLFVDVGGGFGHQCVALKSKLAKASIPGRIVLQDLPAVLAHAMHVEGVEHMAHDFMTEQPVKGI